MHKQNSESSNVYTGTKIGVNCCLLDGPSKGKAQCERQYFRYVKVQAVITKAPADFTLGVLGKAQIQFFQTPVNCRSSSDSLGQLMHPRAGSKERPV